MAEVVQIQIVLDDGTVKQSFATIERQAKKSAGQINRDFGANIERGLSSTFGSLKFQILGLASAFASAFAGRAILAAANRQEEAVNNLNASLISAGRFSQAASQSFQDFADSIQATTRIGDEATLELVTLANAFARSDEEAKALVQTAIDLSAATGISLESAVRNLGKTFSGLTGELGEAVPQVRQLTKEQLQNGEAIKVLADRYGGFASQQVNTFSGALEQLSNVFGDLLEELGQIVTRSPSLIAVFKTITQILGDSVKSLNQFRTQGDVFKPILVSAITLAQGINTFVVAPLELAVNVITAAIGGLRTNVAQAVAGTLNDLSKIANFVAPNSTFAQNLKRMASSATTDFFQLREATKLAEQDILTFNTTSNFDEFLEKLRVAAETASKELANITNNTVAAADKTSDAVKRAGDSINSTFRQGVVNGLSAGIQTIGASLVQGGRAFDNFGKTILGIIGDVAIQIGNTLIGIGLGIDALKTSLATLSGGVAIAAGIALVALGGALKSLGGGGLSVPAGSPGGSPGQPLPTEDVTDIGEEDIAGERSKVTVNIKGDVLDSDETGTRIAKILTDQFAAEGVDVVRVG